MKKYWVSLAGSATLLLLAAFHSPLVLAQGAITSGQTVTGTISPAGDSDTWTFSATIGDAIVLRVGEITQTGSFSPRIRLFDPSNAVVSTQSGTVAAEIAVAAAATGTYTVIVDDLAGTTATGTYRLTLARSGVAAVASPGDEGGALTNGAMHTGTIDLGDLDVWSFTAMIGEAIVVRMGETVSPSTLTPLLRLYSPSGTLLSSSTSTAGAEVTATAAANGTYVVVAGDFSASFAGSGGYRLTLAKTGTAVSVSPGDEGGPLTNGAMHTGTLEIGDLDVWTFTATTGEAIVVRMGESDSPSSLTPLLRLYSPGGALLSSSTSTAGAEVTATAPANGTYLVVAGDFSSSYAGSGGYRLTLAKTGTAVTVSPGDEGGPLTNGAVHTGTLEIGDLDVWTFSAAIGDAIIVRMGEMAAGTLTPLLRLYGPGGALLASSFSASGAEVTATAVTTGTYLVVAGDFSATFAGTGDYRLTLAKTGAAVTVSPGDQGGPMSNGAMHTGTLEVGDLDVWTISAVAGEAIVVRMGEAAAGGLTPWLRLYSPGGTLLSSSTSTAGAEVTATAGLTGTYLVVAGDLSSSFAGSGDYRLTLAKTGSPVIVSVGDQGGGLTNGIHTGVIDLGDLDVWTIRAQSGDHLVITMTESVAGSSLTPQLRLYTPAGVLLGSNFGTGVATLNVTTASSGIFLLVAGDFSSSFAGSGGYTLNGTGANGFPATPNIDVDASVTATKYDPLTDGVIILRYLLAVGEQPMIQGALGGTASRTDPAAVQNYLDSIRPALDVDGNGTSDPFTDGVLIIRYLFGLRGEALINSAFDPLGSRTTSTAIENYILTLMP